MKVNDLDETFILFKLAMDSDSTSYMVTNVGDTVLKRGKFFFPAPWRTDGMDWYSRIQGERAKS